MWYCRGPHRKVPFHRGATLGRGPQWPRLATSLLGLEMEPRKFRIGPTHQGRKQSIDRRERIVHRPPQSWFAETEMAFYLRKVARPIYLPFLWRLVTRGIQVIGNKPPIERPRHGMLIIVGWRRTSFVPAPLKASWYRSKCPVRFEAKTIRRPSGDQTGSMKESKVNWVLVPRDKLMEPDVRVLALPIAYLYC
jgi:hypothetical protein